MGLHKAENLNENWEMIGAAQPHSWISEVQLKNYMNRTNYTLVPLIPHDEIQFQKYTGTFSTHFFLCWNRFALQYVRVKRPRKNHGGEQ